MSGEIWQLMGALGPVFALIGIGFALRRYEFAGADFWSGAERLTYFVLFPALIISRLSATPMSLANLGRLALASAALLLTASLLLIILRRRLSSDGPSFSSVYQGGLRFNTFLGLAAAAALYGSGAVAQAAMLIAVLIPLVNVLCVAVLSHYAADRPRPLVGTLRALLQNPLILACAIGIALSLSGIGPPPLLSGTLDILARAALPLGLLAVGAGLRVLNAGQAIRPLAAATVMKLFLLPLLAAGIADILGMQGLERQILVLFAVLPGAPSAFLLARQMGGNADLMAAIVTAQTALALLSMPLMIWLLG